MLDFSDPIPATLLVALVAVTATTAVAIAVRRPGGHESAGTDPAPTGRPAAAEPERASSPLPSIDDPQSAQWLTAAVRSLAARPIWKGERIAQPLIVRATEDWLELELEANDSMAAPVPWVDVGRGRRWRLMRSTPVGQLPAAELDRPMPAMVAVGDGLLVNLEGLGLLTIDGGIDQAMDLVRSIVHQLLTAGPHGSVDVRSTFAVTGIVARGLVRRRSPAELMAEVPSWLDTVEKRFHDRSAHNAYSYRLGGADPVRPIVVVTDPMGARDMPTVLEAAGQRRLPLAVIIVGGFAEKGEAAISLRSQDVATLEPWQVEFVPARRSATAGRRLAELLDGCGPRSRRRRLRRPTVDPAVNRTANRSRRRAASRHPAVAMGPEPEDWPHGSRSRSAGVVSVGSGRHRRDRSAQLPSTAALLSPPAPPPATPKPAAPCRPRTSALGQPPVESLPEIRVLGGIDIVGLGHDLTSQQLSLLTFLACHPGATRDGITNALWDGQVISKSRFPNLLAETRGRVGRHYIPDASDGRYKLVAIGTDLDRFEQLVKRAAAADQQPAAKHLRSALELVRGVPFTPPASRFWSWVGDHGHVAARVESAIADAAVRLARFEQKTGRLDEARWACEHGLAASPADQTLVTILTDVYRALGKSALAARLVESWEERIERLDR